MSKKPYDFLVSEKEPFLYLEKSILKMKDGFLTALSGENGIKIISPSGTLVLMLGAGTSITQEAAIFCAYNDMQLCFARGGTNIHSFFMSGRYQDPISLTNQVLLAQNKKLEVAQALLCLRMRLFNQPAGLIQEIQKIEDNNNLLLWEARWYKALYKQLSIKYIKVNGGEDFKRNFTGNDYVNERLNILNNALYSICTAICLSCSLSPSVGFIHGTTRRGGLSFDLADIYKPLLVLDLAFNPNNLNNKQLMYKLSNRLKENNNLAIKQIIKICLFIGGDNAIKLEEI